MQGRKIRLPYLLFLGDADPKFGAKTAEGVLYWRPDDVTGQSRLPGGQLDLGVPDIAVEDAAGLGAKTLLIGVTNRGGVLPDHWVPMLVTALEHGLDLASGLHRRLADIPELAQAAKAHGRQIYDVRHWSGGALPIATGERRAGKRVLMIGTDCASGKKFSALAIEKAMKERGVNATFRATGQTGVLIAGTGVAIDAVPADFIAGAVEMTAPANAPDHWDVIEGQASVLHPSFGGVTLGLVHGAQPDAMVLCHEPGREFVRGLPNRALPSLTDTIAAHESAARVTNLASRVVAVSLDTHRLDEGAARHAVTAAEKATGLPASDLIRFDSAPVVDAILNL